MEIHKKKYAICKKNGYHAWCDKDGPHVDSLGETINDMEVVFTCGVCGAEAEGSVDWNEPDEEED